MTRSRQPDVVLLSAIWGALWACALGAWLVAPAFVAEHHIHPQRVSEWIVLTAGLTLLFAFGGLFLGVIGGYVPITIEKLAGKQFRQRAWAYALCAGPLLVVEYAGESLLIHWATADTVGGLWSYYGRELTVLAIAVSGGSMLLIWFYRRVVIPRGVKPRVLAWALGAMTLAGMLALIPTVSPAPSPVTVRLDKSDDIGNGPLLFVGLDGATWRVLQPAIAAGHAPTFQRLTDTGVHGIMEAEWFPYWSSAAWASIVTGLPRDVTGVYESLEGRGRGLPSFQMPQFPTLVISPMFVLRALLQTSGAIHVTPHARTLLNGKPVWQLLHESGVNTAVVRFRFTYPPADQAGIVISDWAGHDEWEALGVRRQMGPDTVTPQHRADELLAPFRHEGALNPGLFSSLLPGPVPPKPADALGDPIEALRIASDIDERTFEASESILGRNPAQAFLAVYIGGLDAVEHAFWQYRFPDDFEKDRAAPEDIARLGPVVDRYVRYIDGRLARLLARYATPPNVVIVSDHGHGAGTVPSNWRGWHTKEGVFVAAGPEVPHRRAPIKVSYYDVLPTLAHLKGFRVSTRINGRSVLDSEGY